MNDSTRALDAALTADVLVIGSGPTGLLLAGDLAARA